MTTFVGSEVEDVLNERKRRSSRSRLPWKKRNRRIIRPPLPLMKPLHKKLDIATSTSVWRNAIPSPKPSAYPRSSNNSTTAAKGQLLYRRRPSSTPGLKVEKGSKSKVIGQKIALHGKNFAANADKMRNAENRISKEIDDRILQISRVLPPEMTSKFILNNFMRKRRISLE